MTRLRLPSLIGLLAFATSSASWSQSRAPIVSSVDLQVLSPPAPVTIAGKRHLGYELRITNFRPSAITLTRLEVRDAVRGTRVGDFRDADLDARLARPGGLPDSTEKRVIGAGMYAIVYLWLALDDGVETPSELQHRIELDVIRAGVHERTIVEGGVVALRNEPSIVLQPPLRGGPWVALYDPMMIGGHRTSVYAVNGRARIPARFAIDWIRLEGDGTHARGDRSRIANWHGYGAEVLAVVDATVADARDDIAEEPSMSTVPVPLENASGNFVCLDLGNGRYAFYEHLRHGSIRVKAGDRVRSGQVLAQLGNSGSSSSGPHLHFHVSDGTSELASEGLPYVFKSFEVIGAFETIQSFQSGAAWRPVTPVGKIRTGELPAPNTVVLFPADPR